MVPAAAIGLGLQHRRAVAVPLALASAAEIVYDKLPQASARTEPAPLIARITTGAIAGGIVTHLSGASIALGAATGALAALASTFLFHRVRAAAARRVPPLAAAFAGDALAIGTAAVALRLVADES